MSSAELDITTSKPAAVGARYRMASLQTKVEGRGGATKTVIINCDSVASALHTETSYLMKFLSLEMGAALAGAGVHALKGRHAAPDLQKTLKKFIDAFILCPNCKLPELRITIDQKAKSLRANCTACSAREHSVTSTHKIKSFMIKNPPKGKDRSTADSTRSAMDEVAIAADAAIKRVSDSESKKEDGDVQWHSDFSIEARAARWAEELQSKGGDDKGGDPIATLRIYLQAPNRTSSEAISEWTRMCVARNLIGPDRFPLLLRSLLKYEEKTQIATLPEQCQSPFVSATLRQAGGSIEILQALETFLSDAKAVDYAPHILQALYEADVLSETHIMLWAAKAESAGPVRIKATPFIEWLKTAETEQ
jgi:translation initiation factor 2 beta subunit (eIF-2beta)/eIF-5